MTALVSTAPPPAGEPALGEALPPSLGVLLLAVAAVAQALAAAHLLVTVKGFAEAGWRRFRLAAWLAPAAAVGLAVAFGVDLSWQATLMLAGLVLVVVVALLRRTRSAAIVNRWGDRARRTGGVATTVDVLRTGSALAVRRKAPVVRPSLRDLSRVERARLRTREVGVELCRTGGVTLYSSLEDVVTIFGGPRVGKTGWLAARVIDAPGAVLTTSTRLDLMEITREHRARRGPVYVFNPAGLGDLDSTVTFNPLTGCQNPTVATERAADMIPESEGGSGDRAYWDGQARRALAALMHAAALGELTMRDVLQWVADPKAAQWEITSLLRKSPEPSYLPTIEQWIGTNEKTLTSITNSMMPALAWLNSRHAAAAATGDGPAFDVADLLASRGTVYLLGRHEAHTAPLLAAFTGYVAREARRLAALQPGGRLDPPLELDLDEAARVVPVPLPDWTGDFGGSGLCIICAFQSRADIVDRYGPTGAAKILNNSGSVLLFGGTKDTGDLDQWSKLAGDRDEVVITRGKDGRVTSRSVRKVPVLTPAQLANLPAGRVVAFRRGMPPAIGRTRMVWRRVDVRQPWWWRAITRTRETGVPAPAQSPAPAASPAATQAPTPAPAGAPALAWVGGMPSPTLAQSPASSPAESSTQIRVPVAGD